VYGTIQPKYYFLSSDELAVDGNTIVFNNVHSSSRRVFEIISIRYAPSDIGKKNISNIAGRNKTKGP